MKKHLLIAVIGLVLASPHSLFAQENGEEDHSPFIGKKNAIGVNFSTGGGMMIPMGLAMGENANMPFFSEFLTETMLYMNAPLVNYQRFANRHVIKAGVLPHYRYNRRQGGRIDHRVLLAGRAGYSYGIPMGKHFFALLGAEAMFLYNVNRNVVNNDWQPFSAAEKNTRTEFGLGLTGGIYANIGRHVRIGTDMMLLAISGYNNTREWSQGGNDVNKTINLGMEFHAQAIPFIFIIPVNFYFRF